MTWIADPDWRAARRRASVVLTLLTLVCAPAFLAPSALAAPQQTGPVTGLPVPRFVSLKSDRVNLREGPSKDHRTIWIFQRAGLPVEITAEFDIWRRIRDSDGSEGWVLHSLLSGRRTGIVSPWKKGGEFPLRRNADVNSPIVARLQAGVIGSLKACNGKWCRLAGEGYDGWIEQEHLWGAYPGENIPYSDRQKPIEELKGPIEELGGRTDRRFKPVWRSESDRWLQVPSRMSSSVTAAAFEPRTRVLEAGRIEGSG
ncbi:MAG: SH3 domain-containing protein [Rhodoblastus sp.]